jgi:hypothetical protein
MAPAPPVPRARSDRRTVWFCRAAMLLVAGVTFSACESRATTAPDTSPVPLTPGRQLLTLAGFGASLDPSFPPCTPMGVPRAGTSVATIVVLEREGTDWVARSEPSLGTLEVRLRGTAGSSGGYQVTGTVAGTAADVGLMGVVRDVRVTLGLGTGTRPATFDGMMGTAPSSLIVGRVTGPLRFSDSEGNSSTCPAIQWSMQPY